MSNTKTWVPRLRMCYIHLQMQLQVFKVISYLDVSVLKSVFLISSAQLLVLESAMPAAFLRQTWTATQRSKYSGWWPGKILRLKCYCCSDPDFWKQPSVTAPIPNLKCGLPAARRWQTGSLFSGDCLFSAATSSRALNPQGWELSIQGQHCAEEMLLCSNIIAPLGEVSMAVLPTGSSICQGVWDSGLCSQHCLCILHETVTR